jgi:hypothetical protein
MQCHHRSQHPLTVSFGLSYLCGWSRLCDSSFQHASVCYICEGDGHLICCEGTCLRSFHPQCHARFKDLFLPRPDAHYLPVSDSSAGGSDTSQSMLVDVPNHSLSLSSSSSSSSSSAAALTASATTTAAAASSDIQMREDEPWLCSDCTINSVRLSLLGHRVFRLESHV